MLIYLFYKLILVRIFRKTKEARMEKSTFSVGFGKTSIWGAWKTKRKLADEMDVRVCAIKGNGRISIIAVFDLGLLWPSSCAKLSEAAGKALKIPSANIGIFTTQNHAMDAKAGPYPLISKLSQRLIDAAKKALNNMQPASMATINVHPKPALNFCRRVRFGKFGAFTFWFGLKKQGQGKADASHLVKMAIKSLAQGIPLQYRCMVVKSNNDYRVNDCPVHVPSPLFLKKAHDDLLQGIFFKNLQGEPIGSIIRFAAHPVTSNLMGANYNSGDYPLYVCRRAEKVFGGASLFLTGPCGDQLPLVERKSVALAQKTGAQIADVALAALKKVKWRQGGPVSLAVENVKLKIRKDIPKTAGKANKELRAIKLKIENAAKSNAPLGAIKKMTERYEVLSYLNPDYGYKPWTGLDMFKCAGKTVVQPLFALRLGKIAIIGLPCEPFGEYSARLRRETIGNALIVAEEGNGYLGYFPTTSEIKYGSYGVNAATCAPGCEGELIQGAKKALKRLGF